MAKEVAWLGGYNPDVLCEGLVLSSVTGRSWGGLECGALEEMNGSAQHPRPAPVKWGSGPFKGLL